MKTVLRNLICCEDVLEDSNSLEAFSMGLLNFHSHYCKDQHDSPWYKVHSKINDDGSIPICFFKIANFLSHFIESLS